MEAMQFCSIPRNQLFCRANKSLSVATFAQAHELYGNRKKETISPEIVEESKKEIADSGKGKGEHSVTPMILFTTQWYSGLVPNSSTPYISRILQIPVTQLIRIQNHPGPEGRTPKMGRLPSQIRMDNPYWGAESEGRGVQR